MLLLLIGGVTLGGCAVKMPSFGGFATNSNASKPVPRGDQGRYAMGVPPAAYGTPGTSHRRNQVHREGPRRNNPSRQGYDRDDYGHDHGAGAAAGARNFSANDRRYLDPPSRMPVRTLRRDRTRQYAQPRLFERSRNELSSGGPFADPTARYPTRVSPNPRQGTFADQYQGASADQYEVRSGDTIYGIARMAGISPQALIDANQLADPSQLRVGMILTLPR